MAVEISGQRPVSDWIALIKEANSAFDNRLDQIYGDNEDLKAEAAQMCLQTLEAFEKAYGTDRSVTIIPVIHLYIHYVAARFAIIQPKTHF